MFKIIAGMILGVAIGASCRWFDIPLPGPPSLVGAFLIVSITAGYMAADKLMTNGISQGRPAIARNMCAGPTGEIPSQRRP